MRVLVISSYDDNMGQPDALVEMPEGMDDQEVFLAWLRDKHKEPELTWKEVEEADCYCMAYWEYDTTKFESLK